MSVDDLFEILIHSQVAQPSKAPWRCALVKLVDATDNDAKGKFGSADFLAVAYKGLEKCLSKENLAEPQNMHFCSEPLSEASLSRCMWPGGAS